MKRFCCVFIAVVWVSESGYARSVFLNGKDISSARSEHLERVSVRIDSEGNVWVSGSHYKVGEVVEYKPVSPKKPVLPILMPRHRPASKLSSSVQANVRKPQPVNDESKVAVMDSDPKGATAENVKPVPGSILPVGNQASDPLPVGAAEVQSEIEQPASRIQTGGAANE